MPRRDNLNLSDTPFCKDLRGLHDLSDSYDKDNVFLTDEGWVYRHYKRRDPVTGDIDPAVFWDEIIVAGEVDPTDATNNPVGNINDATPTFEIGDGIQDVDYTSTTYP